MLVVALSAVSPPSLASASAATGPRPLHPGHVVFDVGVHSKVTSAQALAAASSSSTFPQFTAHVKVGPASYPYVMAGKNPAVKHVNPAATVKAKLIPVIIKVGTVDTWDPTKIDSCDSGASPLARVQQSPAVTSQAWILGGTPVGTGQATDAYQRADFWKYAQPSGINPGYGVSFGWTTLKPVTISVPTSDATTMSIGCGNGLVGEIDFDWLDNYLQTNVIPSLASKGVSPSTLPVFLLHNVVETAGSSLAGGYHRSYTTGAGIQTYAVAAYDNSGAFSNTSDVSALIHELAEWQNDPYGNNPTPYWGHTGQVMGCTNNLEVADPLSDRQLVPVTAGGFTYHIPDLAFFSWFYHQQHNLGVNGWYSEQGNFSTVAPACWDAIPAPLPADAAANPGGFLHGAACPSTCVVAGKYNTSASDQGLLLAGAGDSWVENPAPLPSNGVNSSGVDQVACASATACAAIGTYQDASGDSLGLLLTKAGTTWTPAEAPLPPDAGTNPNVNLYSIACPAAGVCAAVGTYISPGAEHGLLLTLNGTSWTAAEVPIPGGAPGPAVTTSVACPSTSECVAVGNYRDSGGVSHPLILTGLGSSWSVTLPPLPPDAYTFGNSSLSSVTCPSATSCTAVGSYQNAAESPSVAQGLIETGLGSSWTATAAPMPANAAAPAGLGQVACSPSACLAIGSYQDSAGDTLGWLATGGGASWTATQAPVPGGAAPNPNLLLYSATCQGECVAVGVYNDSASHEQGILLTGSGTSWTAMQAPMPPGAAPGSFNAFLGSVSCNPQLACQAVGYYPDSSGHQQGWIVSGTG